MNAEAELRRVVEFIDGNLLERPRHMKLKACPRPDLGGAMAFVLVYEDSLSPGNAVCWGMGRDVDAACGVALRQFAAQPARYVPFTFGSLEELKLKAAAYYG